MMVALHREEEFKLHVRPALKNGVTHRGAALAADPDGHLRRRAGRERGVPLGRGGPGRRVARLGEQCVDDVS